MLSKEIIGELLQLEEGWEPQEIDYCRAEKTLTVGIQVLDAFWPLQVCPSCKARHVTRGSHAKKQTWRHLNGFHVKTFIKCAVPRGRCSICRHDFAVVPCWQGRSQHFTKSFEAFALALIRETTVKSASKVLSESDQRLWRMLFAYMEDSRGELSSLAISILHREWNRTKR